MASAQLDRAAHRRRDKAWLADAWAVARILLVDGGRVPIRAAASPRPGTPGPGIPAPGEAGSGTPAGGPALAWLGAADVPEGAERYLLGVDAEEVPYFAARAPLPAGTPSATLREVGAGLSGTDASLLATAVALANWHARDVYAPASGRPTSVGDGGWSRVTEDGTETVWPRTDPAVIMLVHDGVSGPAGRCLLGRNAAWRRDASAPRYSCLAGFVEPGESAEQAVAREVAEEVGVTVRDVRYAASQPWPFPGSLMLGFGAVADPGAAVVTDDEEITEARWIRRDEITAALAGDETGFALPLQLSIAWQLIAEWAAGGLPGSVTAPAAAAVP